MKLLVTGGAGFIGSNFIRYLLKTYPDYKIINLDKLTYAGNLENLRDIAANNKYSFIRGDIADVSLVEQIFKSGIDGVVNFAAESHVDRSISAPSVFIQTNVVGTHVLLEAAKRYRIKKFLQISTDEVYGSLGDEGYFTEISPLSPNNPYAASKASADLLARAYHVTYGLPVCITRCSNNYGPYQHPEKLIPLLIIRAYQFAPLPIYGDGLNIRDWIHVQDHCRALDMVLHYGKPRQIYDIGANNERTNIDIARIVLQRMDRPLNLIRYVDDRPGHDRRYAIDATKIRQQLGWTPQILWKGGIEETIEWYLTHRNWWDARSKV